MSVAALRELRQLLPESQITLLARPWVSGLFEGQDLVDEILGLPEEASKVSTALFLRRKKRRFDRAILFQNAFGAALASFLARVPTRIGYDTDKRGILLTDKATPRIKRLGRHQIYYYLDLLYQTGISATDYLNKPTFQPSIHLRVPPGGRNQARTLFEEIGVIQQRPRIIINPGAYYGPAKRWFTDRYASVADQLVDSEGAEILVVGSASERKIADEIQGHMKHHAHILSGRTDLASLMGVLAESDLLITNDSGPMHLAAALEVPQIALFGSTDEKATGPYSSRARVVHRHVECSPCFLRECPIDLRCFSRIEVQEIVRLAQSALAGPRRPGSP